MLRDHTLRMPACVIGRSANTYAAGDLLGYVVRDAEYLQELLDALPDRNREARRKLWVEMGLLGEVVPLEEGALDPSSYGTAWMLAAVLADWD